jgi:phage gp46-like protein
MRFQGDIAIKITSSGAKMKFIDGEPVRDQGLENAAQISLFTKKGWWGNALIKDTNKQIGSNYEQQRVIINITTLNDIRNDANDALQWMLDTQVASKIDIEIENPNLNYINTKIKIYPPGQDIQELLFFNNGLNWIYQATNPSHERMKDVI